MEEYFNLFSVYSSIGSQTDSIWNFFVTVHLAIVAIGLLHKDVSISLRQFLISIAGYLAFTFMNGRALIENYDILSASISDIAKFSDRVPYEHLSVIASGDYSDRTITVYITHFIGLIVFWLVFYGALEKPAGKVEKSDRVS